MSDDEVFVDATQPRLLVEALELTIRYARDFTIFRFLLMKTLLSRYKPDADPEIFDLDSAHPNDRKALSSFDDQYQAAVFRHVFFESPSGWAVSALLVPLAFVIAFVVRLLGRGMGRSIIDGARRVVKDEVPVTPEQALLVVAGRGHGPRSALSAYV